MPSKTSKRASRARSGLESSVPSELLDALIKGPMTQAEVESICRDLKKAVIERAMSAEMSRHLGYSPGEAKPPEQSNHRNGSSPKTVLTDDGPVRIEVPRDRAGSFEPQIIPKHERRFTGVNGEVIFPTSGEVKFPRSPVISRCGFPVTPLMGDPVVFSVRLPHAALEATQV